jgi:hypothetical protein
MSIENVLMSIENVLMRDLPPELTKFEEMIDSDSFVPLRQRVYERRMIKTPLSRFTERIYFFPIGIQPNLHAPIEVFCNGLIVSNAQDYFIRVVGEKNPVAVAIFDYRLSDEDVVQARYENVPPP